jgi:peptidoglycan/LPS O-acetylase OafA/YrhL
MHPAKPREPARERLPGLDFLRACAIGLVVIWHFPASSLPFHWRPATWAGVDLFFVLSGYLIGAQLLKPYARAARPSFGQFFIRRMLRVVPAYLAVLALYWLVPVFRGRAHLPPWWRLLTFTMNLGRDAGKTGAFSHAWSLCVEEHFYLILPIVVWWLMRRPSFRRAVALAAGIIVGGMLLRAWIWCRYLHGFVAGPGESLSYRFLEYIYYPTYNRLDGLTVGVALAAIRLFRPLWWERAMTAGNRLLLAGLVMLAGAFWICPGMFTFTTAVLGYPLLALGFGLVLVASLSPQCFLARRRFFGATLVATLSYTLYLTHKEIMHLDDLYLGGWIERAGAVRLGIYLATFFVAAEILHWAVEKQGFRLRDWWLERRTPVL